MSLGGLHQLSFRGEVLTCFTLFTTTNVRLPFSPLATRTTNVNANWFPSGLSRRLAEAESGREMIRPRPNAGVVETALLGRETLFVEGW